MTGVLKRMRLGHLTVHGMRSTCRDYMGELTNHPETVVEHALAHQVGDETSRAYRRGAALLKRRVVMNDWEAYVPGSRKVPKSKVAKLVSRSATPSSSVEVLPATHWAMSPSLPRSSLALIRYGLGEWTSVMRELIFVLLESNRC